MSREAPPLTQRRRVRSLALLLTKQVVEETEVEFSRSTFLVKPGLK